MNYREQWLKEYRFARKALKGPISPEPVYMRVGNCVLCLSSYGLYRNHARVSHRFRKSMLLTLKRVRPFINKGEHSVARLALEETRSFRSASQGAGFKLP